MKKTLFIGTFFDGNEDNYLLFIGENSYAYGKNANKRNELLKKAFKAEYDCDLSDEDISGVFPIQEATDYSKGKDYKIAVINLKLA